jgi:hypothetical protein
MKGEAPLCVDAIGVGDPFCDLLEAQGMVVIRIKGNKSSEINPQKYINMRAQLFGEFADRINPELTHFEPYMVPDDQELKDELVAHEKIVSPDGQRWQVTPKRKAHSGRLADVQSITRKLGRSPDAADAVLLCYAAVSEYETDSHVLDQFDPTQHIYSKTNTTSRGEVVVEVQDGAGNTDSMSESEYISTWGEDPDLVEIEVRAFKEALMLVNQAPRSDHFFRVR